MKKSYPNTVRVNTNISKKINYWLDEKSSDSGIPKSTLIHLALEQYMNQQEAVNYLPELSKVMNELKELGGDKQNE